MIETTAIRIVFFGTPAYAVPTLEALSADPRYHVALVVTQPDRPAGRGRELQATPVKQSAHRTGLQVYQPISLRDEESRVPLQTAQAELFIVAAYGLIFGQRTLAIPQFGCLNLHASLLPAYRGASPVSAAILQGDRRTGVSLMVMEAGLDTGPVVNRVEVPISAEDTTASLTERLATAAAELATSSIDRFLRGDLIPEPQDAQGATKTRPLTKADGWLDWSRSSVHLERQVRAMWPWPRAWTTLDRLPVQIHEASALSVTRMGPPGTIDLASGVPIVACGQGALRLDRVQPASGKPIEGRAWAAGRQEAHERVLGLLGAPVPPSPLIDPAEP